MHLVLLLLIFSSSLLAHQQSLTPSGRELFWGNPNVLVTIKPNNLDMSSSSANAIIQSSIAEWNKSSKAKAVVVSGSANEIKFVSNFPYGSAVVGVTEINYSSSGSIQKAVILLNDDYYFRSTPGLYSYGQIYLGDVVTHELGHLFGLSHSEVLNSSMFYSSFSGQSSVSEDDKAGIRKKYDPSFGSISGFVKGGNDVGVLGAHVQAISRRTGEAVGSISDETGYFKISGLSLNDTYYLYTSPIKNPNSLPDYFANLQDKFCPAAFVGSFYQGCAKESDGKPYGINLTSANSHLSVGTVTISCALKSDADYNYEKLQENFSPITVYDFREDQRNEKAFVGWFQKPSSSEWSSEDIFTIDLSTYPVGGSSKYLKVSLVSFPFGNQLAYDLVLDQNGSQVTSLSKPLPDLSSSEIYQPDLESFIPLSSQQNANVFQAKIKALKLESVYALKTFPVLEKFTSGSYLPYLFITSIWEMTPQGLAPVLDNQVELSDNSSCLDAPYTYEVTRAQSVSSELASKEELPMTPTCGSIDPPSNGPSQQALVMTLGFFVSLAVMSLKKSRKKFLS
jgi:predicted Zn-dependent protease